MNIMDAVESAIGTEYLDSSINNIELLSMVANNDRQPHSNTVTDIPVNRQPDSNWIVNS